MKQRHAMRLLWTAGCLSGLLAACGGDDDAVVASPVTIDAGTPNTISKWNEVATTTINQPNAATGTPEEMQSNISFDLATLHVAMYDAVIAIDGGYQPFYVTPTAPATGASQDAAATAAAYGVLKGLFPTRVALYQPLYDSSLAAISDVDAKAKGVALGSEVAAGVLARRANDGRSLVLPPFVAGTGPGQFRGPAIVGRALLQRATVRADVRGAVPRPRAATADERDLRRRLQRDQVARRHDQRDAHPRAGDDRTLSHRKPGDALAAQHAHLHDDLAQPRRPGSPRRADLGDPGRRDHRLLRVEVRLPRLASVQRDQLRRHRRQRGDDDRPGLDAVLADAAASGVPCRARLRRRRDGRGVATLLRNERCQLRLHQHGEREHEALREHRRAGRRHHARPHRRRHALSQLDRRRRKCSAAASRATSSRTGSVRAERCSDRLARGRPCSWCCPVPRLSPRPVRQRPGATR